MLLASPEPRHRRVQQLLLDVQAALLKKGEEFSQQRRVLEAWTYLEAANRCASLPAEARRLFDNVAAAYQGLVYQQQRKRQQWQEAQRQAAAGHLHTAAELVQGLSFPEAQTFEEDLRRQCQRLARCVTKARDYLDRGQYAAARECYRRARQISPHDPEVVALGSELAARVPAAEEAASSGPTAQPKPIRQRNTAWRLDTLGVVLSAEEISIGRVGGAAIEESLPRVYLSSQIVLKGELDESEWLGRVMLQHEPAEKMSLAILPV